MIAKAPKRQKPQRTNDPERTKSDIVTVATREFAEKGYSGARIDEIAERTKTSKRMIYYYFGSKNGLYVTVLLNHYEKLRKSERDLHLADAPPLEALVRLAEFTFDFHNSNEDGVRLVIVENIHRGVHMKSLPSIDRVNLTIIKIITDICKRGAAQGVMRKNIDPMDLYMSIAAMSFFNISNRHTFSAIFNMDMSSVAALAKRRRSIVDMVMRSVVP